MAIQKKSLMQHYPKRFHIPLAIFFNLALLGFGISIPVLQTEKLFFWEDSYSLITGVKNLFQEGDIFLGLLIFLFSIVFPISKLGTLFVIWFKKLKKSNRDTILKWLDILARWSMLDVFVVAIMVVISKSGGLIDATPQTGIYVFAAAIFLSMLLSHRVNHLAQKA